MRPLSATPARRVPVPGRRSRTVTAAVLAVLAAGCAGASAKDGTPAPELPEMTSMSPTAAPTVPEAVPTAPSTGSPTAAVPSTPAPSTPAPSTAPKSPAADLVPGQVTDVTTGLDTPWGLAFLPDGSALVSERDSARVLHVPAAGGTAQEVGTVPGVEPGGEAGLLGLAVSPSFATDRTLYAYRTAASGNEVIAMTVGTDLRSLSEPRVLLSGIAKASNHDGGRLAMGPDGFLYIGTGDANDRPNAPDRDSLNGKVLRIRSDGSPAPGNPFGTPVFTTGHRNVQGIAFGPDGTVYAAEFGQDTWDELNVLRAGQDYGWPAAEGDDGDGGTRPLASWHTDDASPSGVAYAGGAVWMAGLKGERLWRVPVAGGERTGDPVAYLDGTYGRLRTVVTAPDGSLWVTTSNTDGRGDPKDGDDRILRVKLVPRP